MASESAEPVRPDEIKAIPVRHPGRWVAAAIIVYLSAALVKSVATNRRSGSSSESCSRSCASP